MKLYDGAFQIQSEFGGRNLFQYLLVGDRMVLLDSGIAKTPETAILPYIDRLGHDPARLSLVITTHPDMDHQGGNATLRLAAPHALLACGEADRFLVSDPQQLFAHRYNYLKANHQLGFDDQPPADAGAYCRVDIGFRGGERIALADHWDLEIVHAPGHSRGHLAIYDRSHKSAFVSDAIHGHGCPTLAGEMAIPVTYYYIDVYLSTLRYFEELKIENLYTGHWPNMHGEEVADFLADSRHTVDRFDRRILHALSSVPQGLTLKQLIAEVGEEFPEWPRDTLNLAMFALNGHLEHLEQVGKVRSLKVPSPWRYTIA